MPLIIELLFLAAGLWAMISGEIPAGLFGVLFGKGKYELPPVLARLYGLLLASPLPLAFLVSLTVVALFGNKAIGYGVAFEYIYIIAIVITSIVVARKIRRPAVPQVENLLSIASPPLNGARSYGTRLLIILGLVLLSCITLGSGLTLIMTVFSGIIFGATWTGAFWQDIFPFIFLIVLTGLGAFGAFKLFKLLRAYASTD